MKKLSLIVITVILSFGKYYSQENDDILFFSEEDFISENCILSDTILFSEDQKVNVYNDFKCDSLPTTIEVIKNSKSEVDQTLMGLIPGLGIMKVDTVLEYNSYKGKYRVINFSVGDTIKLFMFMGEGIEMIGYEDCDIEVSIYKNPLYKAISGSVHKMQTKYIESLKGWIEPLEYKTENIRELCKYY